MLQGDRKVATCFYGIKILPILFAMKTVLCANNFSLLLIVLIIPMNVTIASIIKEDKCSTF